MLPLLELQKQFVAGLNSKSDSILHVIKSNSHASARQHLDIYRSSTIGALQKSLKEIFPVCLKLVGEEFFISMSNIYIADTPSCSGDLADYGANFPSFIANFSPAQALPYLPDVARLEWAWHRIFGAADNTEFDFQQLNAHLKSSAHEIIFLLPNECFLITSSYPIHKIWETNQEFYSGEQTIILQENFAYYFLVWRNGLEMRIDQLSQVEHQVLMWMQAELTIQAISTQLTTHFPEINFVELLPEFVNNGWLVGFKIPNTL